METKSISVHNSTEFSILLNGIEVSPFMKMKQTIDVADVLPVDLADLNVSDTLFCSYCNTGFLDQQQQRQHYKLDWHRYNLKQQLAKKKTVTEERFTQLTQEDDVSSISGSETESEDEVGASSEETRRKEEDRLNHLIARKSRILFNNSSGQVISLHRCLLLNKKEEAASDQQLVELVKKLPIKNTWLVIMIGGGHFAASIFKGGEAVLHKTFHSYTVRAKQGGSQSAKDNKGAFAKSAGSSLRRYNEQSLTQHVQDLVKNWGPDINKCDLLFYRAVGRGNSNILFGGSNPPLLRSDPRVRSIPFTTRRPTFSEVKRVYSLLTTAFVYDSNEMFRVNFSPRRVEKESKEKSDGISENKEKSEGSEEIRNPKRKESPRKIDRGKERSSPVRELPDIVQQLAYESSDSTDDSIIMECTEQEISFVNRLQEFSNKGTNSFKLRMLQKRRRKKEESLESKEVLTPNQLLFWKNIHGACEENKIKSLRLTLENSAQFLTKEDITQTLNTKNIDGQTILHKMALDSRTDVIRLLLLHGSDPTIKDKRARTPYDVCPDKPSRIAFRRFMGDFPDMYDYSKSHIPSALTEAIEAEINEKKRASRKIKRQKEKERKQAHEAQKYEEDEKKRFLALSDREKRALAAEKRLLQESGKANIILARCYLCAEDISGKVPFEYEMFRFCSMECLKAHRVNSKKQIL